MAVMNRFRKFTRDETAQDLIEYALLVGLVSLVAVAALTLTGTKVNDIFTAINTQLTKAIPAA